MRRDRMLRFDALEGRQLLASAHAAAVSTPIAIDGTLTTNVSASAQTQNLDGSYTTTVPIAGTLQGVGKVKGTWETRIDAYGNYLGPDQLLLQSKTPKGSIDVAFINVNKGKPTKVSAKLGFYQHGQHVVGSSGAFAHSTEAGSIELMDNLKKGQVASIVLITVPPAGATEG